MEYGETGGAIIRSNYLYILSIILVIAKIIGLVTFGWGICLLPAICVILIKCVLYGWAMGKLTDLIKEIDKEE